MDAGEKNTTRASIGALVLGGLISLFLSGIVTMQVYLYIRVYTRDRPRIKFMVGLVWAMDLTHTGMVSIAAWMNLVDRFDEPSNMDYITWSIGASVALTAAVTFLVHCFFIHRIHIVSNKNKYLTYPLAVLAFFRLGAALVSTSKMISLASYSEFLNRFGYVFTMGLGSAVALDLIITAGMCYYLRRNKSGLSTMNAILDTLVLYTVETGMITCITTIASLACWLSMPHNLIFLGLHFTISKLYANSFMAILNSRVTLGPIKSPLYPNFDREQPLPILLSVFPPRRPVSVHVSPDRTSTSREDKVMHSSLDKVAQQAVSEADVGDGVILDSIEQLDLGEQDHYPFAYPASGVSAS